jgi:site-specific recombinase XerD
MAELEPIKPEKAKEMFVAQRDDEVSEKTLQAYHYRLKPFVEWCEQEKFTNLNDLSARSLHEYRLWRKEDGDLKTITLKGQLSTLRVFVKFLESIDGVEQGLHDKMLIPSVEDEEAVSNSILEAKRADQVLEHLGKYEYASKRHTLLTVFSRFIQSRARGSRQFCQSGGSIPLAELDSSSPDSRRPPLYVGSLVL